MPYILIKIFPFDSGAFAAGMYNSFFHTEMDINCFSLCPPTTETIKRFIDYFYGDNDCYYRNKSRLIDPNKFKSLELKSYLNLLNNRGETLFDERYSTIEVISKVPAVLEDSVIAVIAPLDFRLSHADVLQRLRSGNVDIITYNTFGGSPNSYNGVIRDKLYTYLCQKGFINATQAAL